MIEVAHRLFLEEGFGATSIDRIAQEAGVSAPTVYAQFGSKVGLLSAVADLAVAGDDQDILMRDRPELAGLQTERDPREWLRLACHLTREVNERSGRVLHLIDSVAGTDPAAGDLAAKLRAGRLEDAELSARNGPVLANRPDLTVEDVVDVFYVLGGHEPWMLLVEDRGRTPEEFEAWLFSLAEKLLL